MKVILLNKDKSALLDDEDCESIGQLGNWKAKKTDRGWCAYTIVQRDKFRVTLWMHNVVAEAILGRKLNKEVVLNKNLDKLDNRRENVEIRDPASIKKQRKVPKRKNHYRGVQKLNGYRYAAVITYDGKTRCIGYYSSPREAAKAYDKKAKEVYGEFSKLNFP